MARGHKHPVYDFLFEYYSWRPAHLLRWTPGFGVVIEGATPADVAWREFTPTDNGLSLPASAFPEHRVAYLRWAVEFLARCSRESRRSRVSGCTSGRWCTAIRPCGTLTFRSA